MISAIKEPTENNMAATTPFDIDICIAAIFSVPRGREPRKLTSMPVKKILKSGCICKYKREARS
jgi:hypothetical protein